MNTPTESLILEVLAARYRLGEQLWTFDSNVRKQVQSLADKGLVIEMHGIVEHSCRASLTDAGKAAVLSATYLPPEPPRTVTIPAGHSAFVFPTPDVEEEDDE